MYVDKPSLTQNASGKDGFVNEGDFEAVFLTGKKERSNILFT